LQFVSNFFLSIFRFMMNVKLFCVMGVSWFLEIVATVYKQNSLWWSISDTFNCLQGVLVFLIFVFKKKVLVAFRKKLGEVSLLFCGWNVFKVSALARNRIFCIHFLWQLSLSMLFHIFYFLMKEKWTKISMDIFWKDPREH